MCFEVNSLAISQVELSNYHSLIQYRLSTKSWRPLSESGPNTDRPHLPLKSVELDVQSRLKRHVNLGEVARLGCVPQCGSFPSIDIPSCQLWCHPSGKSRLV